MKTMLTHVRCTRLSSLNLEINTWEHVLSKRKSNRSTLLSQCREASPKWKRPVNWKAPIKHSSQLAKREMYSGLLESVSNVGTQIMLKTSAVSGLKTAELIERKDPLPRCAEAKASLASSDQQGKGRYKWSRGSCPLHTGMTGFWNVRLKADEWSFK